MLVIGAGVAGTVAAMRAAAIGVSVSLIDKERTPLAALRSNDSRVISPTLFDWPSQHWNDLS